MDMKTTIILFAVMLSTVVGLIGVNSSGNIVAAKSYKLIVYLDGAVEPNNLGSFKVVVYNSDNNTILSEKVTPDFSDDHQKISPSSGYKITDKEKRPSQPD